MAGRRRGSGRLFAPVSVLLLVSATVVGWLLRMWWRLFVTAAPVTGKPLDNATLLHAATKDLSGRPFERLRGPLWRLLAVRWAVAGLPSLLAGWAALGSVLRPALAVVGVPAPWWLRLGWSVLAWYWSVAGAVAFGWAAVVVPAWWRGREHRSEFAQPAWEAACGALGLAYHRRDARRMVTIPAGYEPTDVVAPEEDPDPPLWRRVWWRVLAHFGRDPGSRLLAAQLAAEDGTGLDDPAAEVLPARRWLRRQAIEATADLEVSDDPVRPDPVVLRLPPGKATTTAQRKALLSAVGPVLGMPDPLADWYPRGKHPYVELRPNLPPPPVVPWPALRRVLEAAPLERPLMGLAPGGRPEHLDYKNNSPHVLVSGGSGTGKSVLLKVVLGQRMHNGAGLIILDYKRVSHRWAHNLDGCLYAWRIADIHDLMVMVGAELDRRLENVLPPDNDVDADMAQFPTVDVLVEEINSLALMLRTYWAEMKQPGDPAESPAVAALKLGVNMGREFGVHWHVAGQRVSASVFGANGGDIRESFTDRLLAKWTRQTWAMLAGGLPYQRFPPNVGRGVWGRITDEGATIVRVPNPTTAEIRAWATSGVPSPTTPLGGELSDRLSAQRAVRDTRTPSSVPELVSLSAAVRMLPGPEIGLEALRKASQRPGFPPVSGEAGAARTYDLAALRAWKLDRDDRAPVTPERAAARVLEPAASPFDRVTVDRRPGRVYQFRVLQPETGAVVCGYVGQTRRTLREREEEHRGDKPWSDLIVGSILLVAEGDWSDEELDAAELERIVALRPLFNYQGQEGAPWAVPKWTQVEQRQERNQVAGLPLWRPVDVYHTRPARGRR